MTRYQAGETVTLIGTVTPDGESDLTGIASVTVSAKLREAMLLENVPMTLDIGASTASMKIYKYDYNIPEDSDGRVFWWVTVSNTDFHKTITKDDFYVEAL